MLLPLSRALQRQGNEVWTAVREGGRDGGGGGLGSGGEKAQILSERWSGVKGSRKG